MQTWWRDPTDLAFLGGGKRLSDELNKASGEPAPPGLTGDLQQAVNHLRKLIESRKLTKEALADGATKEALAALGAAATHSPSPEARLEAIALLGKTSEISKPAETAAAELLRDAVEEPLSPPSRWGTAEDHYYLAKALSHTDAIWIAGYAARELVAADVSERKSRDVWVQLAIDRSATLTDVLEPVAATFDELARRSNEAADTAHRRLIRVAESLDSALVLAENPVGSLFASSLASLARPVAKVGGDAKSKQLREDAADSLLALLARQARMRFQVALDSDVYRAVGSIRSWWRPGRPPDRIESRARSFADLAMSALHLLARQGVRDRELRDTVARAFDPTLVNRLGAELARADPLLSPEDASWLASGDSGAESREEAGLGLAAAELELDQSIARLLIAIHRAETDPSVLRATATEIDVLEPEVSQTLRAAADDRSRIDQWITAMARSRNVSIEGEAGAVVGFDPGIHETESELKRGQQVRVVSPAVVRSYPGRPNVVVLRASVAPA